jgi:hypothetical protein
MNWLYPTIQLLSTIPGYPSTTQAQKIDSTPLHVKGKSEEKPEKLGNIKKAGKSPKLPVISVKQSRFIEYLTNPKSPSYGNQTASYKRAYGLNLSDSTAAAKASQAVRRDKVHSWIDAILRRQGVDTKARVAELALIAHNKSTPRTNTKIIEQGGKRKVITTTEQPTHSERLRAIDQLNKLSGDYVKASHAGTLQAQADYDRLMSRTFSNDKARTARADRCKDVTPDDPTGKTGGRG